MRFQLLAQGGRQQLSMAAAIKAHIREAPFDGIDVAAAYVTLQGIRALERILGRPPVASRWIVGLDDAISQPQAIEYLLGLKGAEVRVSKLSPKRRFHPKMYRLFQSDGPARGLLVVGSGNLTERGLHTNAEGAVLLKAETLPEVAAGLSMFNEFWGLGHELGAGELSAYAERYERARKSRKAQEDAGDAPPEPAPSATVAADIPGQSTPEAVLALAVARIASAQPNGQCSLNLARDMIPKMVPLTAKDYVPYAGQTNPRWVQIVRNIQSNSTNAGPGSTNFIARGYLEHIGEGYRVTESGRRLASQ